MKTFKEYIYKGNINIEDINENLSDKFQPGESIRASQMKVGNYYFTYYRNIGDRVELFKFTGFSNAEETYGKSGPIFDSIKEVKKEYGIKTMNDLENLSSREGAEYGMGVYMCGEWDKVKPGCYYYVCNKSWSRGSGCDKISFSEAVPIEKEL